METLAERIEDTNKTSLHPAFVKALHKIAENESLPVDIIWNKWQEYIKACYDQSALLSEFCTWNKFKLWDEI